MHVTGIKSSPVEDGSLLTLATCNDEGDVDLSKTAEVQIVKQQASLCVILDPNGEDHDILIEQQDDSWNIYVHPNGGDPLCVVRLYEKCSVVEDDMGNVLATNECQSGNSCHE